MYSYCILLSIDVSRTVFLCWMSSVGLGFFARIERGEKMFHALQTDSMSGEVIVETCVNF